MTDCNLLGCEILCCVSEYLVIFWKDSRIKHVGTIRELTRQKCFAMRIFPNLSILNRQIGPNMPSCHQVGSTSTAQLLPPISVSINADVMCSVCDVPWRRIWIVLPLTVRAATALCIIVYNCVSHIWP